MKVVINDGDLAGCPIVPSANLSIENDNIIFEVCDSFLIDLRTYINGYDRDNFNSLLIRLIYKADNYNLIKLAKSYASECLSIWLIKRSEKYWNRIIREENV